jgi:hypothetical protein
MEFEIRGEVRLAFDNRPADNNSILMVHKVATRTTSAPALTRFSWACSSFGRIRAAISHLIVTLRI